MCLSSLQVTDACLHAFLFASVHSALPFFVQDLFFVPPCLFCCFLLAHSSLRVAFVTPCSSLVLLLASVCAPPPLSPTFCHAMFCAPVRCSRVKTIAAKSAQVLKRKSMLQFKPTKATTHSRCHTRACGSMCCCRTNEECKRKRRKKREEGRNSTAEPMSPKTEHNTVQGKGGQAKQQRAQTNHKPNQTGLWQKGQKL